MSPRATDDLIEIADYIAADSPQNAVAVLMRLDALFDRLADPIRPGHRSPWHRQASVYVATESGYHVFFDPTRAPPVVLRVVRGSRDLRELPLR